MSSGESGDSGGDIGSSTAVADASPATIGTETAPASVESATTVAQEAQYTGEQGTLSSAAPRAETAAIGSRGWQDTPLSQAPTEASPYIPDYAGPNQQSYGALDGSARVDALERSEPDTAAFSRTSRLPEGSADQPPLASERVEAGLEADRPGVWGRSGEHSEVYTMFNPRLNQVYVGLVENDPAERTTQQSLIVDYESRVAHGLTPDRGWGLPVHAFHSNDAHEAAVRAQVILNYYRDQDMVADLGRGGRSDPQHNFMSPRAQESYRASDTARGNQHLWEPLTEPVHRYEEPPDFSRLGETRAAQVAGYRHTYETYTMYNERTGEIYSGKTSGSAGPIENVAERYTEHVASGKTPERGWQPAVLDQTSPDSRAIDAREVQLQYDYQRQGKAPPIDKYHRGASPRRAPEMIATAEQTFGPVPAGGIHHPYEWWPKDQAS